MAIMTKERVTSLLSENKPMYLIGDLVKIRGTRLTLGYAEVVTGISANVLPDGAVIFEYRLYESVLNYKEDDLYLAGKPNPFAD